MSNRRNHEVAKTLRHRTQSHRTSQFGHGFHGSIAEDSIALSPQRHGDTEHTQRGSWPAEEVPVFDRHHRDDIRPIQTHAFVPHPCRPGPLCSEHSDSACDPLAAHDSFFWRGGWASPKRWGIVNQSTVAGRACRRHDSEACRGVDPLLTRKRWVCGDSIASRGIGAMESTPTIEAMRGRGSTPPLRTLICVYLRYLRVFRCDERWLKSNAMDP